MSRQSEDLRDRASRELRESRNGGSAASKADNVKRAAAYETLAENEEWLAGEQSPGTASAGAQPDGPALESGQGGTASQDQI